MRISCGKFLAVANWRMCPRISRIDTDEEGGCLRIGTNLNSRESVSIRGQDLGRRNAYSVKPLRDSRPHLGPSARQVARSVAPGVAPVATRQSIGRGKPFPSAGCASAREKTEATGDPFAPPVRLSAPTGHGRPAPPLREASAPPDETASRGTRGRSREQGARGKRRAEPRRVFRGPTGRATRRFTSAVSGGSERRAPGSPRGWPVGGRPRKTSERTAARRAPFVRTDCRAEPHFTQAVKTSPRPNPSK